MGVSRGPSNSGGAGLGLLKNDGVSQLVERALATSVTINHHNASSLNWQSLSTELFTALHFRYLSDLLYIVFLTSHKDAVSGRQPLLNWLSLCRGL